RLRLPTGDPLAAFKTANKLPQVLARVEATAAGADEALLLNTAGRVAEGSSSNLFWIAGGQVWTPPLTEGALGGVTRAVVLELCGALGIPLGERGLAPAELRCAAGVFLTLSTHGIVVARSLDGQPLAVSPLVDRIRRAYWEAVAAECNPGSTLSP
ncbi:MAG: aminotransferase class IV, partial [Fimbriimonas ginsengisoli]|nr:aminotransferase class IV [Fimbriimonas ginsengisoli]